MVFGKFLVWGGEFSRFRRFGVLIVFVHSSWCLSDLCLGLRLSELRFGWFSGLRDVWVGVRQFRGIWVVFGDFFWLGASLGLG